MRHLAAYRSVSPAKAGAHRPDPELRQAWIPAFAGMSGGGGATLENPGRAEP